MTADASDRLPVTLLTGFLGTRARAVPAFSPARAPLLPRRAGSGKTTLLNHILTNQRGLRIGALVNEFGAVDIDSSLLVSNSAISTGVTELTNGCICCTINDSLRDALLVLLQHRDRLDHLLLETSGVSDPGPVLETLKLPGLGEHLRLDAVVTVADASRFAPRLDGSAPRCEVDATNRQLVRADLVVLNKIDLLSETELRRARACVQREQPSAHVLHSEHGRVAPELLLQQRQPLEGRPPAPHAEVTLDLTQRPPRGQRGHLAEGGFWRAAYCSDRPMRLESFEALRATDAWRDVVRAKGFLRFAECPGMQVAATAAAAAAAAAAAITTPSVAAGRAADVRPARRGDRLKGRAAQAVKLQIRAHRHRPRGVAARHLRRARRVRGAGL